MLFLIGLQTSNKPSGYPVRMDNSVPLVPQNQSSQSLHIQPGMLAQVGPLRSRRSLFHLFQFLIHLLKLSVERVVSKCTQVQFWGTCTWRVCFHFMLLNQLLRPLFDLWPLKQVLKSTSVYMWLFYMFCAFVIKQYSCPGVTDWKFFIQSTDFLFLKGFCRMWSVSFCSQSVWMISHLHSCHPPPPPHTSSQASLDPLLVSSLYASVAGMPRLDSVRLPVGCRGESLGGLLDQNASVLVKKKTPSSQEISSFFPVSWRAAERGTHVQLLVLVFYAFAWSFRGLMHKIVVESQQQLCVHTE